MTQRKRRVLASAYVSHGGCIPGAPTPRATSDPPGFSGRSLRAARGSGQARPDPGPVSARRGGRVGGNHPDEGGVGTCVAWQRLKGQQLKPFKHFCAPTIAFRGSAPSSRLESGFWSGNIESGVCGAIRAHADGPAGPQEARNPDVQERLLYGSHFSAASITDRR